VLAGLSQLALNASLEAGLSPGGKVNALSLPEARALSTCLGEGRAAPGPRHGRRRAAGDSYDNALAESVIGLFTTEVIRCRGPWRSIDAVEFATLQWVDWFNNRGGLRSQ